MRHPTAAQPESASLPGLLAVAGIGCVCMVRVRHQEAVRAFSQNQLVVSIAGGWCAHGLTGDGFGGDSPGLRGIVLSVCHYLG